MRVRSVDTDNDWNFGKGKGDYKQKKYAVAQSINTRLKSFLGDCFFSKSSGIDWFNLLGSKRLVELRLSISAIILNTQGVTSIVELTAELEDNRTMNIKYSAETIYGSLTDEDVEV